MKLQVKKLITEAVLPTYATEGSNGLDITATALVFTTDYLEIRTGIAVSVPKGYVGLLFPRSSVSKKNLVLSNSVGVIDEDYRGEITFRFKVLDNGAHFNKFENIYKVGERVGQLLLVELPKIEVVEVKDLDETKRNTGGYGSTGV